jgi:hypothetical protein
MVPVTKADGEKLAKDLGAVKYVECSALTQYELKDVFDKVRVGSSCYFNFDLFVADGETTRNLVYKFTIY